VIQGRGIVPNGSYIAPRTVDAEEQDLVQACDVSNLNDCAVATVTLIPLTVTVSPNLASVILGTSQAFTARVTGPSGVSQGVTWCISPQFGSVDQNGVYTAPDNSKVPSETHVFVTATSTKDNTRSGAGEAIVAPVTITISGTNPFLANPGAQDQLIANVFTGTNNNQVIWSASSGTIDGNGVYTPPSALSQDVTPVTITACLAATTTICNNPPFILQVVRPVSMTVTPTQWPSAQNIAVTINGSGFGSAPVVTFSDPTI